MKTSLDHRTHLIHTSGTTSDPKAVQIAVRSVLQVVFHAPFEPLLPTDTIAHVNNTSFDVSLFDIWPPLLRGARIAILRKAVLLDPPLLAVQIDRLHITIMVMTATLLSLAAYIYPNAFAKLRICIFGGEAANISAIKTIMAASAPDQLINAYGPTECCIFCLAHQVTKEDIKADRTSIGNPLGRTVAYICDKYGGEVPDGEEGELLIGGMGVSPGYLNQPEKNVVSFVTLKGDSQSGRLYRTGDIVRRRVTDGQIGYIGRCDHQVKVSGFRVELEEVESTPLRTGYFADAVVLKVNAGFDEAAGSMSVAFAVPAPGCDSHTVLNAIDSLKAVLPEYMVPRIELISKMPVNNYGKMDRRHLEQLYQTRWAQQAVDNEDQEEQPDNVRQRLARLWANILGLPIFPGHDNADFFLLEATSKHPFSSARFVVFSTRKSRF